MYHAKAKIAPRSTTPPIAPPAIAPTFTGEDVADVAGNFVPVALVRVRALVGTEILETLLKFLMVSIPKDPLETRVV